MLNKVLVVDDSALIHQMYRLVLARYRCEVVGANNGQEALDILARFDDVQLVLLDINMPVMNGVQFLEKASQLGFTPRVPVVIVSTEGKEEDTIQGLKLGACGYLTKPFTPSQLHEVIVKVLQQSATGMEPEGEMALER
ncbi:response regulator [Geomonas subterranea]|uniref:Response regulator n=1 Tax=Geomonas subterranea TaxID=2847989 RepID=A0ABX8LNS6_9BACT|nr:response regulator [Geomonas subterranea]QXM11609.1 response regulator [Geomonas subterranea]